MASSFSRKSSSSASKAKAPKPTFRKAGASGARKVSSFGSGSSPAASRPTPAVTPRASKPAATYRAPIKVTKPAAPHKVSASARVSGGTVSAKSVTAVKPVASAKSARPTARGPKPTSSKAVPAQVAKRTAGVKPPRTAPVTVKAAGSAPRQVPVASNARPKGSKSSKKVFRLPNIGRAKPVAPRKLSGAGAGSSATASASAAAPGSKPAAFAPPHPQRTRNPLARALGAAGSILSRLPLPRVSRKLLFAVLSGVLALVVAVIVVVNSPLFAASEIVVNGSEHVTQQAAQQLVDIPEGTTLFNVNEGQIADALKANPWVIGVDIKREYPHKLIITPRERSVKAIAYITADAIAWAIGEDGAWIAPLSLSIAVDANGAEVQPAADGTLPEGAQQLSGLDAALAIAKRDGALLLTDVPSDVEPTAGESVDSDVVNAGLEYAKGFTPEFLSQIKDLSVASVEAISANLTSGVEVSLGEPERITEKERVVTKLLSQENGVTYINVREPGAYTFRSAPS